MPWRSKERNPSVTHRIPHWITSATVRAKFQAMLENRPNPANEQRDLSNAQTGIVSREKASVLRYKFDSRIFDSSTRLFACQTGLPALSSVW